MSTSWHRDDAPPCPRCDAPWSGGHVCSFPSFKLAVFSGPHPSLHVDCPTCKAPADCYCNGPDGTAMDRVHDERRTAARSLRGDS